MTRTELIAYLTDLAKGTVTAETIECLADAVIRGAVQLGDVERNLEDLRRMRVQAWGKRVMMIALLALALAGCGKDAGVQTNPPQPCQAPAGTGCL